MLDYPTLNLFLYDLREGLGQNEAKIQQNKEHFLQKLPTGTLILEHDDEIEYQDLLGEDRIIAFKEETHDGYYYPVCLNDTYGLLLNYSLSATQDSTDQTWLETLQNLVVSKINNQAGTLGETWFLSAQLKNLNDSEILAEKWAKTLFPKLKLTKVGESKFLDGVIIEFQKSFAQVHIIFIFYLSKEDLNREPNFYPDWMRLLCYRHKITWAYKQSRQLVSVLKQGARDIQACEKDLRGHTASDITDEKLQKTLDKAWQILADYATNLDELNDQAHTIAINLGNYNKRFGRLTEKVNSSLEVLQEFSTFTQEKYLPQVKKDYKAFNPKLRRLEDLINYIRTSVAIREEVREKKFQNKIAIWGIGLATGAIMASVSGQLPTADNSWLGVGISIVISGLFTAIAMGFAWLWQRK